MKFHIFLLGISLLSFTLFSCEDGEDIPLSKLEGTYSGTFQRTVGNEAGQIAQVTISFENNTWQGQSDTPKYPALCNGTYELKGQIINFQNHCMFTADFDWSLILNGDFEIKQTTQAITFTKVLPNTSTVIKDVYTLQRSMVN